MKILKRQSEVLAEQAARGERRDPMAATINPVAGYSFKRQPKWNADTAITEALYSNIYVYACARARAQDLAALPIRVGADPDKPKDFDPNHPLAKLLGPAPGGPTMNISARRLIAWTLMQYDVTGRFAWEIAAPVRNRRDGVPFELWPLPTGRLTPKASDGGAQWFSGFEFTVDSGRKKNLSNEQVLYYWRPSQDDFREPESLLQAARLNVSIAVMQDRYDYAFILNDARPAAVVVHEAFEVKRERDAFRRQFLESHRGPDNAGKTAFVETSRDGATPKDSLLIQSLGLSQRDAEFIERYENEIRAICVAFATPLSRLADSSRRTYANAERETLNYWRNAVKPAGVELAEAFNIGLMPLLGDSNNVCWFDTTGIPELEPPRRFAVGDIPELVEKGIITQNEGRHGIELPAVPGGDDFRLGNEEDAPAPDPNEGDAPVGTPESGARVIPLQRQVRSVDDAIGPSVTALSSWWGRALEGLAELQRSSLYVRANGKRGRQAETRGDIGSVYDTDYWSDESASVFDSLITGVYTAAIAACAAEGRPSRSTVNAQWVSKRASAYGQRWVEHTRAALESVSTVEDLYQFLPEHQPMVVEPLEIEQLIRAAIQDVSSTRDVVSAESAARALVAVHRGEMSPADAIASLA